MENEKPVELSSNKPVITIEYYPKCYWMSKAAYMAQEIFDYVHG